MAILVKLHDADGDEVLVNLDQARWIEKMTEEMRQAKSRIIFDEASLLFVQETFQEITQAMLGHGRH